MKEYKKGNLQKSANKIVIYKDGMQIFNPTEDMILEDGWVEYIEPQPTDEELLNIAKETKIAELTAYDKSNNVNYFYIGDVGLWLDLSKRTGLELRFKAEIASGIAQTTLWHEGMQFPLSPSAALQMLYALELYASACYDNTEHHRAAINALTTIEEVEAYDYTLLYPNKLKF